MMMMMAVILIEILFGMENGNQKIEMADMMMMMIVCVGKNYTGIQY